MANPPKGKVKAKAKPATAKKPAPRSGKTTTSRAQAKPLDSGQKYVVSGTVTYADSTPAIGLTVIAYDKDESGKDILGQPVVTKESGAFAIPYSDADFRRTKKERGGADVIVCVYNAEKELLFTSKKQNNAPANYELNIKLPAQPFVVRGTVRFADGTPLAGALVRAYDKDLRSQEQLGQSEPVTTDIEGRYEITYTAEQFSRVEKRSADLLVETRQNEETGWIPEPIRFNAQPTEVMDITLGGAYRGPSEFRRLVDEITPLLDGLTMAQLTENSDFQDITFLSNESGVDRQLIVWLAVSALRAEEEDRLQHEEYYGLSRQNLPTDLDALFKQETDALRGALENSARDNTIRPMTEQDLADFVLRVQQIKAGRVLRPAGSNEPASLGDFLAVAIDDSGKRELVAKYSVEHGEGTDAFWKALEEDGGVNPDDVRAVRQTLALGTFTDNHLPLVQELSQMGKGTAAFAELRGFAQLDEMEWQAILQRPQESGNENSKPIGFPPGQESVESYARTLNQYIETTFPTAVISNRLKRDDSNESPFKETKSDLLVFFANNPEFSFADTPPTLYLSKDASEKLRDIEKPDVLREQLKSMQRVFNITPHFPEIRALLADDLHSATAMVYVGERRFTEKYAEPLGGTSKAREAYKKAEHVHATALNVYMKHAEAFNSPTPYVISGGEWVMADPQTGVARNSFAALGTHNFSRGANLRTLFGSLDLCDCRHCQSLYSPAAYLVDILKFLNDGPKDPTKGVMSPLDVLLSRRPDIEHIELTCENTNTQLPYVDLVNEILEAAIVPRFFKIPKATDINAVLDELKAGRFPAGFPTVFANNGYSLTDKASVRVEETGSPQTGSKWMILDSGWAFSLHYEKSYEGFVIAWPQTSWTSDELRANPEHIHDPAYTVLGTAVYPWNLPLNLPVEEMRIYLDHLGVPRRELVETFISSALPSDLSDAEIIYEYLGLGKDEANIVVGRVAGGPIGSTPTLGAWNFWGLLETGNPITNMVPPPANSDWDVVLRRVSIFLQQSGLSYKELLELLGTYFINPLASVGTPGGRLLGIVSIDAYPATCNLSKLEIQVVDDGIESSKYVLIDAWDRIHHFVRLWRKLGWTMRDLDKAITSLPKNVDGYIGIEDLLLNNLSQVQRLHVTTRLPVVKLLSWWGDIDTGRYVDHLAEGEPTVASLYEQLFSNKTVSGQILSETGTLSGTLSEKAAAIAAALQISVEDFKLLQVGISNDGGLTLANLSLLYRHASLAKVLKLSIRSYLTALELVTSTPFSTPARTNQFIKHVDKIRTSGFTIEDLNYLLRNQFSATYNIAATDEVIATVLDAMRDDLRKVSAENTFVAAGINDSAATSDPNGELTRTKLALLNWEPALIEKVIAVLNDTVTYETTLTTLATTVVFPESLKNKISYDSKNQKLRFTGAMTAAQRAELVAAPNNTVVPFVQSVGQLFEPPREFVSRYMARFSVPVSSVLVTDTALKLLLAKFKFPEALKSKIYYDTVAGTLNFVGVMTEAERSTLLKLLPSNNETANTIQALFNVPAPTGTDIFITSADAASLLGNETEVRFQSVLKTVLPYLQTTLSEIAVKQRLSEYVKLDATVVDGLLKKWIKPQVVDPTHPERRALADFLDPVFSESNPNIKPSKDAFPQQFTALVLLYKIAILVQKFNITSQQLPWLFDSKLNAGWLDLNALPLGATAPTSSLFTGWERLSDLFQLRDALPSGEALLADIFTTATAPRDPTAQLNKVLEILSKGAQWDLESLKSLSGPNGYNYSISSFSGERAILRLSVAFAMLKRLGASADQCLSWAKPYPTGNDARELKSLVRAKYDDAEWLELAKSLHDPLRERQRSALVAYLVQALGVRDADDLYDRFLIDVGMSPCMMTTRIKQAISSVQLFIQRALMNLDDDVSLTPKEAQEWSRWRKWYRVWEANRKVLLYPENWIEPELRDDKSPFYKDLENELLQSDVTMATAEDAFLHYLEKLNEVARLEIVGLYHQTESASDGATAIDILHVIGRTAVPPHIHYYRRRVDSASWTAWEKVEADIQGNHLIPLIWNRRLYLFWATFAQKQKETAITMPAEGKQVASGKKYLEIQLSWSEYRNGKWSAKRMAAPYASQLTHPEAPLEEKDFASFSFKTSVANDLLGDEQLSLDCYGPTEVDRLVPSAPAGSIQETFLFSLSKRKGRSLTVTVSGKSFQASDVDKVEIVRRSLSGAEVRSKLEPDGSSELYNNTGVTMKYYVASTAYAAQAPVFGAATQTCTTELNDAGKPKTTCETNPASCTVNLINRSEQTTDSRSLVVEPMHPMVSFRFDDSQGNITPLISNAVSGLEPIAGTHFENMMLVEDQNGTDNNGLGLLQTTPGTFRLLGMHQSYLPKNVLFPIFFQDNSHVYFVFVPPESTKIRFAMFHHPKVRDFLKALNRSGIRGLLTLANQRLTDSPVAFNRYVPNPLRVDLNPDFIPREGVDFSDSGAYSIYNWELFFHTPFLIAMQLSKNQRFEEAQKWFHYIFDPTATDSPARPNSSPGKERFWRVKPFYDESMWDIQTLEELIADTIKLKKQVDAWQANPFKPHVIARIRVVAYMKAVVMRYIDNLIAWGDQLFRRDTLESINEATQLYILAGQILGRRPERIPARAKVKIQTFRTLDDVKALDSLSNAMVEIESFLAPSVAPSSFGAEGSPPLKMRYFCIPGNDKLLSYWDTVSDRLFKIRHCLNIEGVERSLPIFEPPIDPGLLIRAAAAGVDIASALSDINAAVPHYRFNIMLQKATELCNDVKAMGGALLAALEKRDAEALSLVRSTHELKVLNAVRTIKEKQIEEAKEARDALEKSKEMTAIRRDYYRDIAFMNEWEITQLSMAGTSLALQAAEVTILALAGGLSLIPNLKMGAPTSLGITFGGENVGESAKVFSESVGKVASLLNSGASMAATVGGHERRFDDWKLQERLADKDLEQIDKQIAAADIRKAIAEKDLSNHDLQIENAKEIDAYMHDKFTNQELYNWMVGQISGIYFQSYQLAYDAAKRAERTYRYELGLKDSNFIQFGYWDSLRKGLLSGERLYHDLKRMDVAYLDKNKREHEITKHISLITIDPVSLVKLKETGECFVNLPEALFDIDYPGHYMRRIKSVSITIPCVTGPYAGVNCTLTQLKSSIRHANTLSAGQYERGNDDTRFSDSFGSIQSIVTSSAQNDSGLFETNLRDERYLPFEGQGAISTWRIQLPKEFKPFDYDTISDVVLHLRYTARDAGDVLRKKATDELSEAVNNFAQSAGKQGLTRIFSLRHEFPTEWHRFTSSSTGGTAPRSEFFAITKDRFPLIFSGNIITIAELNLYAVLKSKLLPTQVPPPFPLTVTHPPLTGSAIEMVAGADINKRLLAKKSPPLTVSVSAQKETAQWSISIPDNDIGSFRDNFEDLLFVCHFSVAP